MYYKDKLKTLRKENNLKQKDLMDIVGYTEKSYSSYEIEHDIFPLKKLNNLCNYFDVSLDYMFGFTDKKNYSKILPEININIAGLRLKDTRKELGLTQKNMAEFLNTSQSVIADYERGRYLIATPFLYTICKKYGISADYLLGKIDSIKYLKKNTF